MGGSKPHVDGYARAVPEARAGAAAYRIVLVCLGNICRSPTAATVLRSRLATAGLTERVEVESAGTGDWHLGNAMDRRASQALTARGYDPAGHRAQRLTPEMLDAADLVLAMDEQNYADMAALADGAGRLRLFRDFDPHARDGSRGVPDPYHGGGDGFEHVLTIVARTCETLVGALRAELEERRR